MGWEIGYDSDWNRDIGYGVVAYCDHPKCNEEINRGLAYVCGGEPYGGDAGCGLYFCSEHLAFHKFRDFKEYKFVCGRCRQRRKPYAAKPDHPEWTNFKMTDESWAEWRAERGLVKTEKG